MELCGYKIRCRLSTSGPLLRKIKRSADKARLRGDFGYGMPKERQPPPEPRQHWNTSWQQCDRSAGGRSGYSGGYRGQGGYKRRYDDYDQNVGNSSSQYGGYRDYGSQYDKGGYGWGGDNFESEPSKRRRYWWLNTKNVDKATVSQKVWRSLWTSNWPIEKLKKYCSRKWVNSFKEKVKDGESIVWCTVLIYCTCLGLENYQEQVKNSATVQGFGGRQ